MTTFDSARTRDGVEAGSHEHGYRLSDRFVADSGRVFLTGSQALARLPVEQLRADRAAGLNTAALASGYPGSPLGGIDGDFARAARANPDLELVLRPAVNEELAATTIVGTQLAGEQRDRRVDGVLGLWYGKAQGLDRACDAIRHGVFGGASRHGGAVVLVGDDPGAKSSVIPSSSDLALFDLHLPVFYPGDVHDVLDLGRHAVAMSRATGLWTSMKIVAPVADGSGTVELRTFRDDIVLPDMHIDGAPDHHTVDMTLLPPYNMDIELDIRTTRMERARRYLAANPLNRIAGATGSDAWIGLVATGHTFHELREALRRLGLGTDQELRDAGVRLLEFRVPIPFDRAITRRFAEGLDEIVVVEEKDPTLELLVKDALYGTSSTPPIVGKRDLDDQVLVPNHGPLFADQITPAVRRRLQTRLGDRLAPPPPTVREKQLIPLTVQRAPYFCSGCPHNWGTKVPDGDVAIGAGVGCHTMAMLMEPERVGEITGITQMGGEGAQWIGMSPFVERRHFIQNLGDGTFFHSGQLAVQAAIATGETITYKLLFNGTVAMTGGQDPVGQLDVPSIADILIDHGVRRVIITTDDVDRYDGADLPRDTAGTVEVWDRTRIVEAQELLGEVDGVTVLIHDQACAAQARRLRKRGTIATPATRVVINHRICEACGDCGEVSNCLSVQPIDTPLGVKTTIDQTTCNLDLSCLNGDCPSFMTVEVGDGDVAVVPGSDDPLAAAPREFPDPDLRVSDEAFDLRIAGVGGTGVVTAAQIIATAAMLDGWDTRGLDQTGLSQKAGPVVSDIRFRRGDAPASNLLGDHTADTMIAFDLLAAGTERNLAACLEGHTVLVGSSTATPTGSMIGHPDRRLPTLDELRERLASATDVDATRLGDAGAITDALLGSATAANTFVIGAAVQFGALPVAPGAIEEAIALNGVAVEANTAAFRWGRRWVVDAEAVEQLAASSRQAAVPDVVVPELPRKLDRRVRSLAVSQETQELIEMLTADLVAYQHAGWAGRYLTEIERVAGADNVDDEIVATAARSLHRFMAYKDEYEIARLLLLPDAGVAPAEAVGGQGATITWRLHPPMLKALGMDDKIGLDARIGRPMMKALAAGKRLRGTRLDPFGRTHMRRTERSLIEEFVGFLGEELDVLSADAAARDDVVAALALPQEIRGYEELKLRRVNEFRAAVTDRRDAR